MAFIKLADMLFPQFDAHMKQVMMERMASDNPGQLVDLAAGAEPTLFFIDQASYRHVMLDIDRNTPKQHFFRYLNEISSDIATQIKGRTVLGLDPNPTELPRQHFNFYDGPYLSRFITNSHGPEGQRIPTSSDWMVISAHTYPMLFNGPRQGHRSFFVEIQHTLQHFSFFGPGLRAPPVPERYATNRTVSLPTLASQPAPTQHQANQDQPDQTLPFYYINEPSNTRKQLPVTQDTPYLQLMANLKTACANASYNLTDGRWLARIVNPVKPNNARRPAQDNGLSRSDWFVLSENVFRSMKKRIQEGTVAAIEIEHTLKHARDTGVEWILRDGKWNKEGRREEPAPTNGYQQGPVVWRLASEAPSAVWAPAAANWAPPRLFPAPVPAFLRRLDDVERRPPPPATLSPVLSLGVASAASQPSTPLLPPRRTASAPPSLWCASPVPAPVSTPAPAVVVRMPPVPAPAAVNDPFPLPGAVALAVTPISTRWAAGVVDSAALGWYRREEELRTGGWWRFGEVGDGVESLDVWRGW